jgi:hypothetical protein
VRAQIRFGPCMASNYRSDDQCAVEVVVCFEVIRHRLRYRVVLACRIINMCPKEIINEYAPLINGWMFLSSCKGDSLRVGDRANGTSSNGSLKSGSASLKGSFKLRGGSSSKRASLKGSLRGGSSSKRASLKGSLRGGSSSKRGSASFKGSLKGGPGSSLKNGSASLKGSLKGGSSLKKWIGT